MHCLFFLGNNEEISCAELNSLGITNLKIIRNCIAEGLIDKSINTATLQNQLGGVIKISKIIGTCRKIEDVPSALFSEILATKKTEKIIFGLNLECSGKNRIDVVVNDLKKKLKKNGISSRYLNKRGKNVHDKVAFEAIKKGAYIFNVVENKLESDTYYLAKTFSIQDVDNYTIRDCKKPFRDTKVGMLPPKLAQIMINLATGYILESKRINQVVFDPFCGSGTVLTEALLNGFSVSGSDLEKRMIVGCQQNLDYILKLFEINANCLENIIVHDATKPFSSLNNVNFIVSETHLGPAFTSIPDDHTLNKFKKELESLYLGFFRQAEKILTNNGSIVVSLPYMPKRPFYSFAHLLPKIQEGNLRLVNLGSKGAGLLYYRQDQIIGRQIFKLVKN